MPARLPAFPFAAPPLAARFAREHVLNLSRLAVIRMEWRFMRALDRGVDAVRLDIIRHHLALSRQGMKGRLP